MLVTSPALLLLPLLLFLSSSQAANKDQWRSRSIYQVMTDRFSPATANAPCNTDDRRYCGGTWRTTIAKLDYIQGMGYDAVWISPTGLNIEGTTAYGEAYHGYWVTDPTQLNPHFGTSDDLKALSKALHDRGMYLMADIAVNSLTSLTNDISDASLANAAGGKLLFKKQADYHPSCNINYGDPNSVRTCWLGNNNVYLMDLNQDNSEVVNTINNWVKSYVQEYSIDGFRLDASKHMTKQYQNQLCAAGGVFCIGEVFGDDLTLNAGYTGSGGIDAVFGFGMYYGFTNSFTGSSPRPMSQLATRLSQATTYADPSVIGSFLENQDIPRFNSLESDKSRVYNAIVGAFLYGGIPMIYQGLEQDIADGHDDPHNREALWLYNGFSTSGNTYQRIKTLNNIRKKLGTDANWLKAIAQSVATQNNDIAMNRQGTLIVLTNRGSSGSGTWKITNTGFSGGATVVDLLSCTKLTADSSGAVTVTWTTGQPFVFVTSAIASSKGLCSGSTRDISDSDVVTDGSSDDPASSSDIDPSSSATNSDDTTVASSSTASSARESTGFTSASATANIAVGNSDADTTTAGSGAISTGVALASGGSGGGSSANAARANVGWSGRTSITTLGSALLVLSLASAL